jgi:hypothetical protein
MSNSLNNIDADVREHLRLRDEALVWLREQVASGASPTAAAAALVATAVRILSRDQVAQLATTRARLCGIRIWQEALTEF